MRWTTSLPLRQYGLVATDETERKSESNSYISTGECVGLQQWITNEVDVISKRCWGDRVALCGDRSLATDDIKSPLTVNTIVAARHIFHRLTRTAYLFNGCLPWYNVVLTSRVHSSVKYTQQSPLTAADSCDGGISVPLPVVVKVC